MKAAKLFTVILITSFLPLQNIFPQWILDSAGLGNRSVLSVSSIGNNIFGGTLGNGIFVSSNNGSSWTQTFLSTQNIWSIAVSGNNIFAAAGSNAGIFISTDQGLNWQQTLENNQIVWSIAANGNYVFAGTESNGVYLSSNSGVNWVQSSMNIHSVHAIAISGSNIFAGTFDYGVYLSTNNGASWTQTSLGNTIIINSLIINGINIFAGTQTGGIYLSTNNGSSWSQTSLNNQYVRSVTAIGNNVFAGIQNGGVYISNNAGLNWVQRNEGLGNSSVDALMILNNFILAGTEDGTLNGFYIRPLIELIGIKQITEQVPERFTLFQNFPNPFNPITKIRFEIPKNLFVKLIVFDLFGREVDRLVNEQLNAGTYEVDWSADKYSSGIYYYKLISDDFSETKKMVLIK